MQSDLIFFWDQKWVFKQKRDVLLFLRRNLLYEFCENAVPCQWHGYNGKVLIGAESETSCLNTIMAIIEDTDLTLPAKKRQTEVINKISFQIIEAWELIANSYLGDILCKLNENELDNHENHN